MIVESTLSSGPISSTTAPNTSAGGAPRATTVATRRNAACSSASRASPARLSAFAIAVASSSVNCARRASVSAGSGWSPDEAAPNNPHRPAGLVHDRADVLTADDPPAAHRGEVDRSAPAGDERERTVALVAAHARAIDREQLPNLLRDRCKHLLRRHPPRRQRRDPPQGGLLLVAAPAVGDVATRRVNDALRRRRPDIPFQPPNRTVAADVAVLELNELMTAPQRLERCARTSHVLRMEELEQRPCEQLLTRISKDPLERGVH